MPKLVLVLVILLTYYIWVNYIIWLLGFFVLSTTDVFKCKILILDSPAFILNYT